MKTGLLENRCDSCKKHLVSMENYGNAGSTLCFDCANKLKCVNCGEAVPIADQFPIDGQLYCKVCRIIKGYEEKNHSKQNDNPIDSENNQIEFPTQLPILQLPRRFKIQPDITRLGFATIAMLLPSAGGIVEAFKMSFTNLTTTHILCLALYITFPLFLYRILQRGVILHNDSLEVRGLFFKKHLDIKTITHIENTTSPKSGLFRWEKRYGYYHYLVLNSPSGTLRINVGQIKNHELLRDYLIVKSDCTYDSVNKKRGVLHWLFGG